MELYQDENNKNQQKMFQSTQKALQLEKRVNKLQNTLVQVEKYLNFQHIPVSRTSNQSTFQIESKIDKLQKFMMKKVRKIQEAIYQNIEEYTIPASHKAKQQSPVMTNYSSNQNSRSQKYHSTINQSKKQTKRNEPKVNCFIKQEQNQRPRSPISSYLKKKTNIVSTIKFKSKCKRNLFQILYIKITNKINLKIIEVVFKRQIIKRKDQDQNQTILLKITPKNFLSIKNYKVQQKSKSKNQKEKKNLKKQKLISIKIKQFKFQINFPEKSKRSKSHSLLSVSQTSIKSTSQQKIFKNQKLYKLRCQIKH